MRRFDKSVGLWGPLVLGLLFSVVASAQAPEAPESRPSGRPDTVSDPVEKPLTRKEQLAIFDDLRQKILKFQVELVEARAHQDRLVVALTEARKSAGQLQSDLNRASIIQEIQKHEIRELRGQLNTPGTSGETKPAETPDESEAPLAESDPKDLADALVQLGLWKRRFEKLRLQYRLASTEASDERTRKALVAMDKGMQRINQLEDTNRTLAHTVVTQADEIKILRSRQTAMAELLAEIRNRQTSPPRSETAPAPVKTPEPIKDPAPRLVVKAPSPPAPAPVAADPPPTSVTRISGKISDINEMILTVNVGAKDGVLKGMKLIVFRGDKFVGYIKIDEVQENESLGTMVQTFTGRIAQKNDRVLDRLELE